MKRVVALTAFLVAGCGGGFNEGGTVTTSTFTAPAATTQTSTAPAADTSCPNVALTPGSGHGAFDVKVANISCEEATSLLRSGGGLRSWNCREVERGQDGSIRYDCTSGERRIVFTAGN